MVTSRRSKGLKQASEVAALERRALKELQVSLRKIHHLAIKHQGEFNLKGTELTAVHEKLRESLVATHLLGKRSVQRDLREARTRARARPIRLAIITPELLRGVTEANLGDLVARYDLQTSKVIQSLTIDLTAGVRDALADAVVSNVTPRSAIDSFFSKVGLTDRNAYYFENLLRTQTQIVYSSSRWEEYQSPEIDEIIWGYEYITVGDARVRENHVAMDGVKLPKGDSFWTTNWTPNGYNCRCQVVPVFEPEELKKPTSLAVPDTGFGFNPAQLDLDTGLRQGVVVVE